MNRIFIALMAGIVTLASASCNKEKKTVEEGCFKGRLEKKGICMNYTIRVMEGDIDPSMVEAQWTDTATGTTYYNVFRLGSPCGFPSELEEGDEFYFRIVPENVDCAVCMAYYPTPSKEISIEVLSEGCNVVN